MPGRVPWRVPPPRAKIMNITIQEPADSLLSDPSRHSQSCSRNSRPGQIIAMISDSVNPFIYHPCGKLLRKILSRRRSPQIVSDRRTATVQRKVPWPRSLFFFPCFGKSESSHGRAGRNRVQGALLEQDSGRCHRASGSGQHRLRFFRECRHPRYKIAPDRDDWYGCQHFAGRRHRSRFHPGARRASSAGGLSPLQTRPHRLLPGSGTEISQVFAGLAQPRQFFSRSLVPCRSAARGRRRAEGINATIEKVYGSNRNLMVTVTWATMRSPFCLAGAYRYCLRASIAAWCTEAGPASTFIDFTAPDTSTKASSVTVTVLPLSKYRSAEGDATARTDLISFGGTTALPEGSGCGETEDSGCDDEAEAVLSEERGTTRFAAAGATTDPGATSATWTSGPFQCERPRTDESEGFAAAAPAAGGTVSREATAG